MVMAKTQFKLASTTNNGKAVMGLGIGDHAYKKHIRHHETGMLAAAWILGVFASDMTRF